MKITKHVVFLVIVCLANSISFSSCIRSSLTTSSSPSSTSTSRAMTLPIYQRSHPKMRNYFDSEVVSPFTYGGSLYYIEALVGTPPISKAFIFDTGSFFTWINASPDYDPFGASTTYSAVSCADRLCEEVPDNNYCKEGDIDDCNFQLKYYDDTTSKGDVGKDTFHLFEVTAAGWLRPVGFNMTYGAKLDGSIKLNATIGVSDHPLGLLSALNVKHMSVCFPKPPLDESMARFGYDSRLSGASTPLFSESHHWSFVVEGINVGGSVAQGGVFILDTGAWVTQLSSALMDAVIELVKENVKTPELVPPVRDYEICFDAFTARKNGIQMSLELAGGGSIHLNFDTVFAVEGLDACLAFQRSRTDKSFLGAYQMTGLNFGIDLVSKKLYVDDIDCM